MKSFRDVYLYVEPFTYSQLTYSLHAKLSAKPMNWTEWLAGSRHFFDKADSAASNGQLFSGARSLDAKTAWATSWIVCNLPQPRVLP